MKSTTLISEFLKRPIAYQPIIAKAFGSVNLGILWSQLYYWHDKTTDPEGWIYKSNKEIYEETALSRKEQATARQIGKELGVIEEKVAGCPATVHYRIMIEKAMEIIEQHLEKQAMGQLPIFKEKAKPANAIAYLKNIKDSPQDIAELIDKYSVTAQFVLDRAEDVIDYCESKGKTYKDYKATLRNFIKSHLEKHPELARPRMSPEQVKVHQSEMKKLEDMEKPRTPEEQARINKRLNEIRTKLGLKMAMPK